MSTQSNHCSSAVLPRNTPRHAAGNSLNFFFQTDHAQHEAAPRDCSASTRRIRQARVPSGRLGVLDTSPGRRGAFGKSEREKCCSSHELVRVCSVETLRPASRSAEVLKSTPFLIPLELLRHSSGKLLAPQRQHFTKAGARLKISLASFITRLPQKIFMRVRPLSFNWRTKGSSSNFVEAT